MGQRQRQILCPSRGESPIKACWELASVGTRAMLYDPRGPGRCKNMLGCLSPALPMTVILGSHLLTFTPLRCLKDTFPYLGATLIK